MSINFGELSAGDGTQEESVDVRPGANISEAVESPEDSEIEEKHDPDWGKGDIAGLLDEIEIEEEIEVTEKPMEEKKDVALSVESEGLTFIRLENPYISLGGDAVIPAVFYNKEGNEVIVKIKISVDKG